MKPLYPQDLASFVERFSSFKDAELRSLEAISPSQMKITLAVQDAARAHDWITISLEFNSVIDAKLLDDNSLRLVNMSDGANIIKDKNLVAFGIGECYNMSTIKSSICFIIAKSIKYEESSF